MARSGQCATGGGPKFSRRKVLRGIMVAAAGVTGAIGSRVGFAPTAFAAVRCDAAPPNATSCGLNFIPCFGRCSDIQSCCYYSYPHTGVFEKCCACFEFCARARVVVYASGKSCYYCCQYC